jgi:hypothetical protein
MAVAIMLEPFGPPELIAAKHRAANAAIAATPVSARTKNVKATDRRNMRIISPEDSGEPEVVRDRTTETVLSQVMNETMANGMPSPGAIVMTPRTTQTSVTNIKSEASEKRLPRSADSTIGVAFSSAAVASTPTVDAPHNQQRSSVGRSRALQAGQRRVVDGATGDILVSSPS